MDDWFFMSQEFWTNTTLFILGITLLGLGFIGCVVPAIPGPLVAWLAVLMLYVFSAFNFSFYVLMFLLFAVLAVTFIDQIVPALGVKKLGGTKYGLWGSIVGIVVGLFFMPLGFIVCPFLGAFIGEKIGGQTSNIALKAAWGSLLGLLLGTGMKVFVTIVVSYYFIVEFIK